MADIFRDPRFDALRNALYHTSRRNFLDRANRLANFTIVLLSAGVVSKLASEHKTLNSIIELGVVAVSTFQLVFDFGSRARDHEFLQRRYYELLSEIERSDNDVASERTNWSSKLILISADEQLIMRALDAIAYNNALDALYDDKNFLLKYRIALKPWHSWFRHFYAFNGSHFSPKAPGDKED